jgi:copper chaperone
METRLKVAGMKCGGCVDSVTKALEAVDGVESAEVSLERAEAVVTGSADAATLVSAIDQAGFTASAA